VCSSDLPQASRYVRKLQSRRSLLAWKIFGRRLDGFSNDDHPSESKPGAGDLVFHGALVDAKKFAPQCDIDFVGSIMPPPKAVANGKVAALSDEDRRTVVRWIDLGCPIDLDYDAAKPTERGKGWMLDDERPTLALTIPVPGVNLLLDRILIGTHDFYTGIDAESLRVVADVPIDGVPAGENLAGKFRPTAPGVQEWELSRPVTKLASARLSVSVRDREGNTTRIDRRFSVQSPAQ